MNPEEMSPEQMALAALRREIDLVDDELLELFQRRLAIAAKVGLDEQFVRDFESGYGDPPSGQIEALRSALCTAGAVFDDAPNPGVHLAAQATADEGVRLGALTTETDR